MPRTRIVWDTQPQHAHDDRDRSRAQAEKGYSEVSRRRPDRSGWHGGWDLPLEPLPGSKSCRRVPRPTSTSEDHVDTIPDDECAVGSKRKRSRVNKPSNTKLSPTSTLKSVVRVQALSKKSKVSMRTLLDPKHRDASLPSRSTMYRTLKRHRTNTSIPLKPRGRPRKIPLASETEGKLCASSTAELGLATQKTLGVHFNVSQSTSQL